MKCEVTFLGTRGNFKSGFQIFFDAEDKKDEALLQEMYDAGMIDLEMMGQNNTEVASGHMILSERNFMVGTENEGWEEE